MQMAKYDKDNDIEHIFKMDSIEKKQTGRGIYSRASRRGYVGTVRTTVDFLKGKAKKEYMGNGEVKVSNLYDNIENIPSKREILGMEVEQAQSILKYVKSAHSAGKLAKHWGIANSSVYTLYYKFGVLDKPQGVKVKTRERKATVEVGGSLGKREVEDIKLDEIKRLNSQVKQLEDTISELRGQVPDTSGFKVCLNGRYDKEFIDNRLLNILNTTVEGKTYLLNFELVEEL